MQCFFNFRMLHGPLGKLETNGWRDDDLTKELR